MFNQNVGLNDFSVVQAKEVDSKSIWEIRFSQDLVAVSQTKEDVPFHKHNKWFLEKYFEDQGSVCFVLWQKRKKIIGYCRLDMNNKKEYTISIGLLSDFQRKRLGTYLLAEVLNKMESGAIVIAKINKDNIGSERLFLKQGFVKGVYKGDWSILKKTII